MRGKVRLIGAPPGTGKSAVKPLLQELMGFGSSLGNPWLFYEHEGVFTPEQRVKTADLAGVELSSKEFVLGANLPGQLSFQGTLRSTADQGVFVAGFGPFENVFCEVNGQPLFTKMQTDDFKGFDFNLIYILLEGDNVEEVIQERLIGRANKSPYQSRLDADKVGRADYYESRASLVRQSAETFGLTVVPYGVDESPEDLADKVMEALLAS